LVNPIEALTTVDEVIVAGWTDNLCIHNFGKPYYIWTLTSFHCTDSLYSASPQSQEPDNELLRETWYHAGISREGAEELLKKTTNGHFLVRESETVRGGALSLSLKHHGGVKHFRILKNKSGFYEIPGNPSFKTVPELINYFTQHSITVDPHHRLRFPCAQPSGKYRSIMETIAYWVLSLEQGNICLFTFNSHTWGCWCTHITWSEAYHWDPPLAACWTPTFTWGKPTHSCTTRL